jgi:uncharacterized protein (DUF305 family)
VPRRHPGKRWFSAVPIVFASLALLGGCGGGDGDGEPAARSASSSADLKFLAEMTPHHRSAIQMAELARTRAEHREIATLATSIIAAQSSEISHMAAMRRELAGPSERPKVPSYEMGSSMAPAELARLRSAKSFDAAFIELMVPHHQDAIEMSRRMLEDAGSENTKALARRIISAQTSEIRRMRAWYRRWYGKAVPGGGMHGGGEDQQGGGHSG